MKQTAANKPRTLIPSKLEHPFPPKRSPDAVVETAVVLARQVPLIIARIEMVGDVEDLDPNRRVVAEEAEALADLQVERHEERIAASLVTSPDEVPVLVDGRQRKPSAQIEQREDDEASWQADVAPEEVTVGNIPRQRTPCIGPDHGILDVSQVRVEVVEVPDRRRPRV